MLDEKEIKELMVKAQTNILNVSREYIQNQFLKIFYSLPESDAIYFKGGTALKIIYRSPRFSEDLDFSTAKINRRQIEDAIQETMLGLEREGFQLELKEATITTGGYLGAIMCKYNKLDIKIALEISGRKKNIAGTLTMVENPYIQSYSVMALKREELITEKIEALLNRRKARDFYDLYFMLRANLLPEKKVLKKIYLLVKETKQDFKKELMEFLPKDQQRIIKVFKDVLTSELERYI